MTQRAAIRSKAEVATEKTDIPSTTRLAIRPYPKQLEETILLGDGRTLLLRRIVPEDEPAIQPAFAKLTPQRNISALLHADEDSDPYDSSAVYSIGL